MNVLDTPQGQMLKRELRDNVNAWGYVAVLETIAVLATEDAAIAKSEDDEEGQKWYTRLAGWVSDAANSFKL